MLDRRRLEEAHFKYAALRIASWYHQRSLLRPKFNDILEQFLPHYQKAFDKKYSGEHTNTHKHTHTMHIYTTPIGHRCHSEGCGTVLVLDGNQKNECTKVQNPRRPRVRESLNACANAGKARAIETQGWLCTLLEAL